MSAFKLSHASRTVLSGAFGAALLLSANIATAQTVLEISPAQEREIYTTIYSSRGTVGAAPAREFDVSVGAILPADVELYEVPAAVEYAPVRSYRYATHGNRVVFVEPGTRRVVRVIGP